MRLTPEFLPVIRDLCRRFEVRRLELFGSSARGDFDPERSDFDFLVEFSNPSWRGAFKRYMGLKLALEDLLDAPVDLVEPCTLTNPHFREVATRHTELVYDA